MHLTAEFCNSYVVRFKTSYKGSKRNDDCTGQNTVLSIALLLLPFQFSCVFLCMHVAGGLCDAVYFTVFFYMSSFANSRCGFKNTWKWLYTPTKQMDCNIV